MYVVPRRLRRSEADRSNWFEGQGRLVRPQDARPGPGSTGWPAIDDGADVRVEWLIVDQQG
jgi:hypothetical protein